VSPPDFTEAGDLPSGVYPVTLHDMVEHFGAATPRRKVLALRLERIHLLAASTGHVARFVVFGSFVTTKPEPNDVDVFMLMGDSFDMTQLTHEGRLLFDHTVAQAHFGASVFWVRRLAAFGREQATVAHWQIKRDGGQRGIVEIVAE